MDGIIQIFEAFHCNCFYLVERFKTMKNIEGARGHDQSFKTIFLMDSPRQQIGRRLLVLLHVGSFWLELLTNA